MNKLDFFFWLVLVPAIVISIPIFFVLEVIDNLRRGILFDFK
jgi:hypothetical protein